MALLSVVPDSSLGPAQAAVQALQSLQAGLIPEYVQVSQVDPPPGHDGPVWRWSLAEGAPPILDREVTVYPGVEEDGRWRPTAVPPSPGEIRSGLVVATESGFAQDSGRRRP